MTARYRVSTRNAGNHDTRQPSLDTLLATVASRVRIEAGTELELDEAIYFPIDGIATLVLHREQTRFQIGFGSRGDAIGIQKLFVPEFAEISAKVLKSGSFICVAPQTLRRLLREDGELRERLTHHALRAAARYLEEAARTVALSLDRRVAHWINCCGETLASDIIPITHHDLAHTLGVRRSGVTVALHVLEGARLIRSTRARIEVIDGEGLAAFSRPPLS
ncbi:MAG: Crp/Fnr family transcriptional regulator [Hyphomicrobiales bacterium]|nr:MAG: Crp/Fnr family transcriptional regulator [Hyphomicrobiales bacterium]